MINYSIYCRPSKASKKDNTAPVELVINDGQKRVTITTDYRYSPNEFERLKKNRRSNEVHEIMASVRQRLNKAIGDTIGGGETPTADNVRKYWNGIPVHTTKDIASIFMDKLKPRVGHDMSFPTYFKYQDVCNEIAKLDKDINAVTLGDIEDIVSKWRLKYKPSTLTGRITKLKTVFAFAHNHGYAKSNVSAPVKNRKVMETVETMTEEEYRMIATHQFVGRLNHIRDILIVMCGTGLSYCDLQAFSPENILQRDGLSLYIGKRGKTGVDYFSVILPEAIDVLRRYEYKISIPSNQKLNSYLKEIQDICNVRVKLTCHKCRHYYARTLLQKEIPIEVISKALGHSTIALTQHYAKLIQSQTINMVSNAFQGKL